MSDFKKRDDALRASKDYIDEAKKINELYPVCDGHNDLPWCMRNMKPKGPPRLNGWDLSINHKGKVYDGPGHACLHTDLYRLHEGGVGWQFWSVYTPASEQGPIAIQYTLEQIDFVKRMIEKYPNHLAIAKTSKDIEEIFEERHNNTNGKRRIACMMGMEGGHQINASMGTLRMMYNLGVRYMTLTHNGGPGWADAALDVKGNFLKEAPLNGLTDYGKQIVYEMNRIGMLVDLSHVHPITMKATLKCTRAPVIFSHSSSRALCDHPRDVPDDVLEIVKDNGGVVMVTFVSSFIAGKFWLRGGKVGATVIEVADHIDHIKNLIGIDHIGVGGDLDGCDDLARGLEDAASYPNLTAELLYRGYTREEIGQINSNNLIRVLKQAEEVKEQMREEGCEPSEALFQPNTGQ